VRRWILNADWPAITTNAQSTVQAAYSYGIDRVSVIQGHDPDRRLSELIDKPSEELSEPFTQRTVVRPVRRFLDAVNESESRRSDHAWMTDTRRCPYDRPPAPLTRALVL